MNRDELLTPLSSGSTGSSGRRRQAGGEQMIRVGLAALLMTVAAVFAVLLAGPAAAVTGEVVAARSTSTGRPVPHGPVALASTGLNMAVPVAIGLAALIVGTLLVAWAFLHRTPAGRGQ